MARERATASFATLTEEGQAQAMARFAALRPHLEGGVPLACAADAAGVPLRTAQRWLARYRRDGLAGLARRSRSDAGARRLPDDLVALIEGLGLTRPRLSAAAIHRRVCNVAAAQGWRAPSYGTVHAILSSLDPAMVTLAQDGPAAYRDRYELIHRHRAETPNALWQADHTLLDVLVLDEGGKPARPWLTTVVDDRSRAVAGYMVFLGAPCVLNTCLALRHAIWRKADPAWPVCGVPDVLYVDHGSDFTSRHLDRVAADLRFRVVYSAVGRPQGRGKVERLFGTINAELLPELPGYLVKGKAASPPTLSLTRLDREVGAFIAGTYHARIHGEIGETPLDAWRGEGFLPRLPDSLEDLDLLLVLHAEPRRVRRDGVRFQGLRYVAPTLAGFVGEAVTVRYDPRDLSEIRLFHRGGFLCRAVSEEHAGEVVTLKDIQAARRAHRRSLRTAINERVAKVADFLPHRDQPSRQAPPPQTASPPARTRLRLYECVSTRRMIRDRRRAGGAFIATKEHRRFSEFADAVRKHRYIGLCFGAAGVGKTLSARRYAKWDVAEPLLVAWGPRQPSDAKVYAAIAGTRTVFYTPTVCCPFRELRDGIAQLVTRAGVCIDEHLHREAFVRTGAPANAAELLIVDEAERLSTPALEHLRDVFDRTGIGVILIGMPGIEKRLSRDPQLYSRVGFAHHYRPLQGDELTFVLTRHWRQLGLALDEADFTDAQAMASIARITGGNFRLLHRLFVQIGRILKINGLSVITDDVVEAARSTLVIGAT